MTQAGELKSKHASNLSMTLAYEIALAKKLNATIVTSDEGVLEVNGVKVEFIKVRG